MSIKLAGGSAFVLLGCFTLSDILTAPFLGTGSLRIPFTHVSIFFLRAGPGRLTCLVQNPPGFPGGSSWSLTGTE
ncbi:hypothetical protein BGX38DRAFT_1183301 [Terfezia claveryi]|nr:hypothetical protein BGX38DRAFT_1183301 [Terfezia claveryi]